MANKDSVREALAPLHRQALAWFEDRVGHEIEWPKPLEGLFLVNKAKGIHKPVGWVHALSVRQSLGSPYADKDVVTLLEGGWTCDYFQEGADPAARDSDFTNRTLRKTSLLRRATGDLELPVTVQPPEHDRRLRL